MLKGSAAPLFMYALPFCLPIVWTSYPEFCFIRFHLLAEFDDAKRSCRKRLDGHNRRRRKPQPDTMNSGTFMTSQQGILRFFWFSEYLFSVSHSDATNIVSYYMVTFET